MTELKQPPMHAALGSVGWMRQFRYFTMLYEHIRNVPGDIIECGVGQGTTFVMLCYLAGSENRERVVRGFDSFAGFPRPTNADKSWRDPQEGEWAFSEQETHKLIQSAGILSAYPDLKYQLTKGFFNETLPKELEYPVALLHVDADLYESCRDVLKHFLPLVSKGGIVAFDDYRDIGRGAELGEKWPGATKAIDEALQPTGLTLIAYTEEAADYVYTKYYVKV